MLNLRNFQEGMDQDFWGSDIDTRDLMLRSRSYGCSVDIPEAEMSVRCDGVVWRLMLELRELGVELTDLYDLGIFVWGFYRGDNYSDEWVAGTYRQFYECGGIEGVLGNLRKLGVSEGILTELRGIPLGDPVTMGIEMDVVVDLSKMDEDGWYREMALLLADAKLAAEKGFNTRKEILLMIGKKKGFVSEEYGEGAVNAFLMGLTAKAMNLVERVDAKFVEDKSK